MLTTNQTTDQIRDQEMQREERRALVSYCEIYKPVKELSLGEVIYTITTINAGNSNLSELSPDMARLAFSRGYRWRESLENVPLYPEARVHLDCLVRLNEIEKDLTV